MSQQPKPTQSPSNAGIDMTKITPLQAGRGWQGLESVIGLLEENGTVSAGQKKLTDQQIAVIDGQRRINGGLLDAIDVILDALDTPEASVATRSKIEAAKTSLKGLLGDVPPGCVESKLL